MATVAKRLNFVLLYALAVKVDRCRSGTCECAEGIAGYEAGLV